VVLKKNHIKRINDVPNNPNTNLIWLLSSNIKPVPDRRGMIVMKNTMNLIKKL
jgi:hypothetical protein